MQHQLAASARAFRSPTCSTPSARTDRLLRRRLPALATILRRLTLRASPDATRGTCASGAASLGSYCHNARSARPAKPRPPRRSCRRRRVARGSAYHGCRSSFPSSRLSAGHRHRVEAPVGNRFFLILHRVASAQPSAPIFHRFASPASIRFCGMRLSLRSEEGDPLFSKREVASTRPLPCASIGQPVAIDGNGFGLFSPCSCRTDLRSIATGCNHGAP